jgi:uncharacterized coiled-coil DUF342 family protein
MGEMCGLLEEIDDLRAEVKELRAELSKWEVRFPKGVVVTEMECLKLVDEVERLRARGDQYKALHEKTLAEWKSFHPDVEGEE